MESGSKDTGRGHNGDDIQHVPLAGTGFFLSLRNLVQTYRQDKKRRAVMQDKRHS